MIPDHHALPLTLPQMVEVPEKTKTVALYGRVSTEEQREGQNIDSQIGELERFAASNAWPIAGIYKDEGWSGSVLARPELDRLRDDASKGLFDAVVFNDVDRLARDVTHLGIIKRDLERHGVQVIFRKLPTESSPSYNLMVNILGSFAEFERELIADRTRRGKRYKVEVRKQYVGSHAPFGYRYIRGDKVAHKDGYLEVDPVEAPIVRQMFQWVDSEGLSARKVLQRLNATNTLTRKGGPWAKSSVLRVLRTETYCGTWHFCKYQSCVPEKPVSAGKYRKRLKCSIRQRSKSEWLPVELPEHLRIVDRKVWDRVQDRLNRNITFSPRNEKHAYLLKGLLWCGSCPARYVGDPGHNQFAYRCAARCKRCPSIRETALNETVWNAVVNAILNPDLISTQIQDFERNPDQDQTASVASRNEIEEGLRQLEAEESRLLDVYRLGVISPSQLSRELEKLKPRKASLSERLTILNSLPLTAPTPVIKRTIADYCALLADSIQSFGFAERQELLRSLVTKIVFEGKSVRIRGIIPMSSPSQPNPATEPTEPSGDGRIATTSSTFCDHNSGREIRAAVSEDSPDIHRTPVTGFEFDINAPVTHTFIVNPKGSDGKFVSRKVLLTRLVHLLRVRETAVSFTEGDEHGKEAANCAEANGGL